MSADIVKALYAQLSSLLKLYRQTPLSGAHLQQTLQFSDNLIRQVKRHPDLLVAQLHFYKPQLPLILNLTFNTSLLTLLICARNRVNDSCCQQLLCAVISTHSHNQAELEAFYQGKIEKISARPQRNLIQTLRTSQQQVWLSGYRLLGLLHKEASANANWPRRLDKMQALLYLAHRMAISITPNTRRPRGRFAECIRELCQQAPDIWLDYLRPLLVYPSLTPPGAMVWLKEKRAALILSLSTEKCLVRFVSNQAELQTRPHSIFVDQIEQASVSQQLTSFARLAQWWDQAWADMQQSAGDRLGPYPQGFRLDKPPTSLLDIQAHLTQQDIDVDKLSRLILDEPSFAQHVRNTASQANRGQLPIQDVKHGLMVHGYERANSLLIQQALLLRLNQNYFPLQTQFIQFSQLCGQLAASLIAEQHKILTEQAYTLACFACSGLFTLAKLKTRRIWQPGSTHQFDLRQLVQGADGQRLHDNTIRLASAWQQPAQQLLALRNHHCLPDQMKGNEEAMRLATALGLSLMLARQIYFSDQTMCEQSQTYLQQARHKLKISIEKLNSIKHQAMYECHLVCPLTMR